MSWVEDAPPPGQPQVAADEPPLAGYSLTFWEWVRVRFLGDDVLAKAERRLRNLNEAMIRHPDAPVNYVLRGELYLKARRYADAIQDFERALALSREAYQAEPWGVLPQAMQDRALQGLRDAHKYQ